MFNFRSGMRLATLTMAVLFGVSVLNAQEKPVTAEEELAKLKAGNARFVEGKSANPDLSSKRRIELAQGQKPYAIILTCADSRAVPEAIFDQGLGEIFTIRVAGNVGGPAIYASVEFALATLGTPPVIVVLGHSKCGAIEAALSAKELPSANLKHLVDLIHVGPPPKDPKDKEAALDAAMRANVHYQIRQMTKESDIIKEFVEKKRTRIVPAVYSLKTGEVEWLETKDDKKP